MKKTKDIRIGIVGTSFREDVTRELETRCVATLIAHGVSKSHITVVRVPGALEVPLIAKLEKNYPRQQYAGIADNGTARLEDQAQALVTRVL